MRAAVGSRGRTILSGQSFQAPFHVSKPYWDEATRTLVVQVVNPTAGILSGDRLTSSITVERDAAVMITTPSASRVFRMKEGAAASEQTFRVEPGGWLEVLPEPLVPHRGSRFRQVTHLEVAPGAGLFFVDQLMPGRIGHGEAWRWERLRLETAVRIGGELALCERWDHSGASLQELAAFHGAGPKACFANAVLIGPAGTPAGPEGLERIRAMHRDGRWVGVSALRLGGWSLKIVTRDPLDLRRAVREARGILADYFPRLACEVRKL